MTIKQEPLPYSLDALAPLFTTDQLKVHYEVHHKGYVDKVNKAVEGTDLKDASLEKIIRASDGSLLDLAAQAWNHTFFWSSLSPQASKPSAELEAGIQASFGSMEGLEKELKATSLGQFGSGWGWLVRYSDGALDVIATPNAAPMIHKGDMWPLLTIDVWEHAYYVDYKAGRAAYLDRAWEKLNWAFASDRFAKAPLRK